MTGDMPATRRRTMPATTPADPTGDALLALADLCTAAQPHRRPDAAEVARLAWAAGPAEPLRLLGPAAGGGRDQVCGTDPGDTVDVRQARDRVTAALLGRADPGPGATDITRRVRDAARSATDRQASRRSPGRSGAAAARAGRSGRGPCSPPRSASAG